MRRVIGVVLAAVLVGGVVLVQTAGAHTFDRDVRVTINKSPDGRVGSGERVVIFGQVKGKPFCVNLRQVVLIREGSGRVETDQTDREGEYRFVIRPNADGDFFVRAGGFRQTSYGHSHRCRGDRSRSVHVNVNV